MIAIYYPHSLRGIRVVPEIDVPAHTLAWGKAFPSMVVNCSYASSSAQSPSDIPALNPSKAITYVVVRKVLQAVTRVFPDRFLHLGADEVRPQCWREDAELMAWAPAHGISGGTTGIFDFFEEKVLRVRKFHEPKLKPHRHLFNDEIVKLSISI